jgi:hypothetical protein
MAAWDGCAQFRKSVVGPMEENEPELARKYRQLADEALAEAAVTRHPETKKSLITKAEIYMHQAAILEEPSKP